MPHYQADPADWLVFSSSPEGQRVLTELNHRFAAGSCYVPGGHDAERQTLANAAQRDVLDYIAQSIQAAGQPQPDKPDNSEAERGHDL